MIRPRIGVYRTVYPLYSETFIAEQLRTYSEYEPIVICRDLVQAVSGREVVTLRGRFHGARRLAFTLGLPRALGNDPRLHGLRLLHAHFAQDSVLAMALAERLRIPLVATCHGSDVLVSNEHLLASRKLTNWRFVLSRDRLQREAAAFIAVSDFLREAMVARGYPACKTFTHYVGVDTTRFVPIDSESASGEYLLSIARHESVKGIDILLRAFARISKANRQLRLIQIGGGALTPKLKKLSSDLGISERVEFLGSQSPAVVLRYLQNCRALVLSSRRDRSGAEESFGLVLTEAAACGVPCVGTRVGGIPEAISDGETGFLVESENVAELAERIEFLVSDPGLARAMGRRGRERVCDLFELSKQTRKLEAMYSELGRSH
jgi:colanic acid/amylovoran biosynthesis glycosyltransferase